MFKELKQFLNRFLIWSYDRNMTRAPHAGDNARLQLLLENSKKGGITMKQILRITSPTLVYLNHGTLAHVFLLFFSNINYIVTKRCQKS